jgi:hypothetical protein
MLKERRELLEYEIKKIHDQAAHMYLDMVTKGVDLNNPEYEQLKNRIHDLKFEYEMVQKLIRNNQE